MLQLNHWGLVHNYRVMYSLYVVPEYRRSGVAKKLVYVAIKKAKELNFSSVFLTTNNQNKKAINLYTELNFQRVPFSECTKEMQKEIDAYMPKKMIAISLSLQRNLI